jgi:hypothetical protein
MAIQLIVYIGCWLPAALWPGEREREQRVLVGIIISQSFILKPRPPVIYSMSLIVSGGGSDLWRAKSLFNHIKMKIMEEQCCAGWLRVEVAPSYAASISINKRLSNADSVSSRQQMDCLVVRRAP